MNLEKLKEFWEDKIVLGYRQDISPRLYRVFHSIKDNIVEPVSAWAYNWILLPLYNWTLSPILSATSYIMELISDWILIPISDSIAPVFRFIKSSLHWLNDKIAELTTRFIASPIINIYETIRTSTPFGSIYELLQLEYTWKTKFTTKTKGDPIKTIAYMSSMIRYVLFFALAMTPLMLLAVGASGSHFLTIAIILAYSIAVSITFSATASHNYHNKQDQAAITARMFTSLAILALVYINLSTGGNIILMFSAIIGFGAICFGLANQSNGMQESPIFSDFLSMFNTTAFMPPDYNYKPQRDLDKAILSDTIIDNKDISDHSTVSSDTEENQYHTQTPDNSAPL